MAPWVRCVLAVMLALAACSPVYETGYRLEPPASPTAETQACLAGCAAAQDACLDSAEARLSLCEDRSTLRRQSCEQQAQLDYMVCSGASDRDGVSCSRRRCERASCPRTELASCAADHRRCFAACGGSVVAAPRCVANCPS